MAVPQGRHAAGIELKKRVPRTPLGPSEKRMEGIEAVCHQSEPAE
jgi:hypothetical protein